MDKLTVRTCSSEDHHCLKPAFCKSPSLLVSLKLKMSPVVDMSGQRWQKSIVFKGRIYSYSQGRIFLKQQTKKYVSGASARVFWVVVRVQGNLLLVLIFPRYGSVSLSLQFFFFLPALLSVKQKNVNLPSENCKTLAQKSNNTTLTSLLSNALFEVSLLSVTQTIN